MAKNSKDGWWAAINTVLTDSNVPLHYTEITDQIIDRNLYQTTGATPAASVGAYLSSEIKQNGLNSKYFRSSKGVYGLKSKREEYERQSLAEDIQEIDAEESSIIKARGVSWKRNLVDWTKVKPILLGKERIKSDPIDFSKQVGIYLLHNHYEVIYVGQTSGQTIGERLRQHTQDRLAGKWERFSWFGFYGVNSDGGLIEKLPDSIIDFDSVFDTLEGLLIEAIEPRQNRKAAAGFGSSEYLQHDANEAIDESDKALLNVLKQAMKSS